MTTTNKSDALVAEFQALVGDTEKLLNETANLAGAEAEQLRTQVHESLKRARETLQGVEETLREHSKAAVDATETYVADHPWQSLGLAAALGFLLGLLAGRR
ncbi:DUF883 domain-containing protein [Pseudomonas cavernae]|uniref:DUF883 domain-containing protein n=1 Tax=Pseudomonas cavernae TaxID=2320867 RepID=A0A385Z7H7_9PSED|nr:DUF883 family protein [Pseudomonas cavernae]AYC33472.1 DUF883 domain-containing protein [Pseudomonas cavernae]